jgi:hypothetical protein
MTDKLFDTMEMNRTMARFEGYRYYAYNHPDLMALHHTNRDPGWKTEAYATRFTKFNRESGFPEDAFLCRTDNGLLYHKDWNWMHRVWRRLDESLDLLALPPEQREEYHLAQQYLLSSSIFDFHLSVYNLIVWYNQKQENTTM